MTLTPLSYVLLFAQSNALELPVLAWGYRRTQSIPRTLALGTLSNLITHPVVIFLFMASGWPHWVAVLAAEFFAVVVEAFLHVGFGDGLRLRDTLMWSLVANLVSWQVGPLLTLSWASLSAS
jgi:hypothetical protein